MNMLNWFSRASLKLASTPAGSEPPSSTQSLPTNPDQFTFTLVRRDFNPDRNDRELMWFGLILQDQTGYRYGYEDARLADLGLHVFRVTGVSQRKRELQDSAFAPANFVTLIKDDSDPDDTDAVAVWDRDQRVMVGYVPKEKARAIRQTMIDHPNSRALVMAHCLKRKTRVGLTILFGLLNGLV